MCLLRAEELLWHREAREQALEEAGADDAAQAAGEVALGGAWRAQEEQVLAGNGGEDKEARLRAKRGRRDRRTERVRVAK